VGSLTTYWTGTARTATCSAGLPGTGFSFVVIAQNLVRIISSNGVTFT
jgi:hypothetical protein